MKRAVWMVAATETFFLQAGSGSVLDQGTIAAKQLLARMRQRETMELIDVREPRELESDIRPLPGAKNIPLSDLPKRYAEIPKGALVVLICRSGNRSAQAQRFLKSQGYARTLNLAGGMRAVKEFPLK